MMVSPAAMQALVTLTTVLWVLVTIAAVIGVIWLFSIVRTDPRIQLGERLARGEIDIDEYRARVASLG